MNKPRINRISSLLIIFAVLAAFVVSPLSVFASDGSGDKIRVGYYILDRLQMMDENSGKKSGLGYEYMQKVAQYGDIEYEYVYGEYDEIAAKLASGEVDVMIYRYADYYDMTAYPVGDMVYLENYYLYKRASDTSMTYDNYDLFDGKTFGVLQDTNGALVTESFVMSMMYWYYDTELVPVVNIEYYTDEQQMIDDFYAGKIDTISLGYEFSETHKDVTSLLPLGGNMYYISVAADEFGLAPRDEELYDRLFAASTRFTSTEPGYADKLLNKYFGDTEKRLELSPEEREYITGHNILKVGYLDDFLPYCGTKDGKSLGVITDVIPELLGIVGLGDSVTAEYKPYETWYAMRDALNSGEIDIAYPFVGDIWNAEFSEFSCTNGIMNNDVSIVVKGSFDKSKIMTLAVNRSNPVTEMYSLEMFPNVKVEYYDTVEQCLDSVKNGKTNGYIMSTLRASEFLKGSRYKQLTAVSLQYTDTTRFAVKLGNHQLLGILNRAIYGLDAGFMSDASYEYLDELYKYSTEDFIADNMSRILGVIAIFLVIIIVIIVIVTLSWAKNNKKHQKELEEARKLADDANTAKTAFLFNMSHDIRTPMNAILGYTDMGLRHVEDVEQSKDNYRKIKTAGGHLLNLINDILEMSRIESGKVELSESPVYLYNAIDTTDNMSQSLAVPKSISFETVVGDIKNPYVYADELHITEVIVNLVSNAVKYTEEDGKVTFSVNQLTEPENGVAQYRIEVSDNGIGMSEEFQKHLFEAFARESSSTVSKTEGAGLGLSIVKRIVDMANGTISVRSKLGEGSTFTVDLPFKVMDEAAIEAYKAENASSGDSGKAVSLENRRVLLVEDNEMNREIATDILTEVKFIIETANNGEEAVNTVKEKGTDYYDFILMDIQMPVMDGYTATKLIRELEGGQNVPIIALSANAFEEDRKKSLAAGMNAHIAKPIDVKALMEAMYGLAK